MNKTGSLTIVGAGIKFKGHMTLEAKAHIEHADKVLFAVADQATGRWLRELNPKAEWFPPYLEDKSLVESYRLWIKTILEEVEKGQKVTVVFYGHPGNFVYASHKAIAQARKMGYQAEMLPGISSQACMFADLGFDPSDRGYQCYETTDFLAFRKVFDSRSELVLLQVAMIAKDQFQEDPHLEGVKILVDYLLEYYPPEHLVTVYEAARFAVAPPVIFHTPLCKLTTAPLTPLSTLRVPPLDRGEPDQAMLAKLNLRKKRPQPDLQ